MTLTLPRPVTPGLLRMLRSRNDDGQPALLVSAGWTRRRGYSSTITVLRADGSEPSSSEARHVRATLAAHAASPL